MIPETIAECVGGCADGVQLEPDDPMEPDDWPDCIEMESCQTGARGWYDLRPGRARIVNGVRVYYFDARCR